MASLAAFSASEPVPQDAELSAMWSRYELLLRESRDLYDEAFDPYGDELTALERKVERRFARTFKGVAILLRTAIARQDHNAIVERYAYGRRLRRPPSDADPALWRALVSLESLLEEREQKVRMCS